MPSRRDLASIESFLSGRTPGPTLFTENEKEFEHKVQIASAIAGGVFSRQIDPIFKIMDNKNFYISSIIELTNDLYDKLKK